MMATAYSRLASLLVLAGMYVAAASAGATLIDANLARLGTATQSSESSGGVAQRAIDGGLGPAYSIDATTSHTNNLAFSSWQVDLGGIYNLSTVDLYNRGDCCGNRLSDFRVNVLDAPGGNVVYSQHVASGVPQNAVQSFALPANTLGRVVQVQIVGENGGANDGLNNDNNGIVSLREVVVLGKVDVENGSNLARAFGTASHSSTLNAAQIPAAHKAIDGSTNGAFASGSVTSTNAQVDPSWTVDLSNQFHVDHVTVWERTDAGQTDKLNNFRVSVLDASQNVVASIEYPGQIPNVGESASPNRREIPLPSGAEGKYVRVELLGGTSRTLEMAEVQVFGGALQNVARNPLASATQSSTRIGTGGNVASVAIDGITDGNFFGHDSITHTNTENNPWWELDLGRAHTLSEIVLYNRLEGLQSRLSGFELRVFDALGNETFLHTDTGSPLDVYRIAMGQVYGSTVRIDLPGTGRVLSLAEVQVFGVAVPEPGTGLLLLAGLACAAGLARRKAKRRSEG